MDNKKIEKWTMDEKTSLDKFVYKSNDVDFEAFYLPNNKVQPIFVIDHKISDEVIDPILIINPDETDKERKWDRLLSEKYNVNPMNVRPKKNNKYLKLDVIYKGLNLYRDYVEMPDQRIANKIEHNKLTELLKVCKERLDFLHLDLKRATSTKGTSAKTLKNLEDHLERVKIKLKKIEENPKIEGFTAKEERERSKIFELEDKIKSAKRRIKRAEKREAENQEKIEVIKEQIKKIEDRVKKIKPADETIQPEAKASHTIAETVTETVEKIEKKIEEKLHNLTHHKEDKKEAKAEKKEVQEVKLTIDVPNKKVEEEEIKLEIEHKKPLKIQHQETFPKDKFATKEELKETHKNIDATKKDVHFTKKDIEHTKKEITSLKKEIKVVAEKKHKVLAAEGKEDKKKAFSHLLTILLLLFISIALFVFLNREHMQKTRVKPQNIEVVNEDLNKNFEDMDSLERENRIYFNNQSVKKIRVSTGTRTERLVDAPMKPVEAPYGKYEAPEETQEVIREDKAEKLDARMNIFSRKLKELKDAQKAAKPHHVEENHDHKEVVLSEDEAKKSVLKVIIPVKEESHIENKTVIREASHSEERYEEEVIEETEEVYVADLGRETPEEFQEQPMEVPLATVQEQTFKKDLIEFKKLIGFDEEKYVRVFSLMKISYEKRDLGTFKLYYKEVERMNYEWEVIKNKFMEEFYYIHSDMESTPGENEEYVISRFIIDSYIEDFQRYYNAVTRETPNFINPELLREMKLHTVNPYRYRNANEKLDLMLRALEEINLKQQPIL
ncbi:MAG: hypothetical protein N4A44_02945 [Alphaproteobacteria bacterium]|jgi:hypothetical protein|nr:hypothetical protein [Alphaproteobacteria bacterium]